jgi:hypothetical protein
MQRLQKHLKKILETIASIRNIQTDDLQHMCGTYARPDKHPCNVHLKKQMKHWQQMFATYIYNHCDICNITIYFCNIYMKHLQHTSKTSATLETDTSNIRFQAQHVLAAYEMEVH